MSHFKVNKTVNDDGEAVEEGSTGPIGNITDLLSDYKGREWAGGGIG